MYSGVMDGGRLVMLRHHPVLLEVGLNPNEHPSYNMEET